MSPDAEVEPSRLILDVTAADGTGQLSPAQLVHAGAEIAAARGLAGVLAPASWLPADAVEIAGRTHLRACCGPADGRQHELVAAAEARLAVQFGAVGVTVAVDPALAVHGGTNAVLTRLVTLREAVSDQVELAVALPAATPRDALAAALSAADVSGADVVVLTPPGSRGGGGKPHDASGSGVPGETVAWAAQRPRARAQVRAVATDAAQAGRLHAAGAAVVYVPQGPAD